MVTIRDLVPLLKCAKQVSIGWAATSRAFDVNDPFYVELYGDYVCCDIFSAGEGQFELDIAVHPVKANEVTDNG